VRLTLFVTDGNAATAPQIDLEHISPAMFGHHTCFDDGHHDETFQVSLHHFTPAHARALIELLTPIAGGATPPTMGEPMQDEVTMQRFIVMCQESLDPERYEAFMDICEHLCLVRKRSLRPDSLERCLQEETT